VDFLVKLCGKDYSLIVNVERAQFILTLSHELTTMAIQTTCGVVGWIVAKKEHFGFIRTNDYVKDIYFAACENMDFMEVGNHVTFDVETKDQGTTRAVRVFAVNAAELSAVRPVAPTVEYKRSKLRAERQPAMKTRDHKVEAEATKVPCPTYRPHAKRDENVQDPQAKCEDEAKDSVLSPQKEHLSVKEDDQAEDTASTRASSSASKLRAPGDARSQLLQVRDKMLHIGLDVDEVNNKLKALEESDLLRLREEMLRSGLGVDELDRKLKSLESSKTSENGKNVPVVDKHGYTTVHRSGNYL
jgi:cold shock CspA family protein